VDHFIELADTDGVLDAIKLVVSQAVSQAKGLPPWAGRAECADASAHQSRAQDLIRYQFLIEEHAVAWRAEVVRAFYACPDFASRVWTNLRYGTRCRERLAERVLRDQRRPSWLRTPSLHDVSCTPQVDDLERYRTDRVAAVRNYADRLGRDPETVDTLCLTTGLIPDPPSFIRAVLDAADTAPADIDRRTRELLEMRPEDLCRADAHGIAVPFGMVLSEELDQIGATRALVHRVRRREQRSVHASREDEPVRRALNMDLLGLAFSGGGIRSATFNLGVLQALSKSGLLRQCDYLSTVSGGGYIGSWLAAWIRRESIARAAGVPSEASDDLAATAMTDIERRLSPARSPNPMDERVRPNRFLREYSNYLTPRAGFFSADTWTLLGIYLRNALLNQVIIVSLFSAALLGPRLAFALTKLGSPQPWVPWLLWVAGGVVLIVNLGQLQSPQETTIARSAGPPGPGNALSRIRSVLTTPMAIQVGVVLPWVIAAALTAAYVGKQGIDPLEDQRWTLAMRAGWLVFGSLLVILCLGRADRCWRTAGVPGGKAAAALSIVLAALVAAVVAFGLMWVLLTLLVVMVSDDASALMWHSLTLGTAGLLSVFSLSLVAMLGMLGGRFPDEHREWWSRLRTFIHVWAIGWLVGFVAAVYVPWGVYWLRSAGYSLHAGLPALAGWVASTWFGVRKGSAGEDDRTTEHESGSGQAGWSAGALRLAAHAAPFVFIIGLVAGLSVAIDAVFFANWPGQGNASVARFTDWYWQFASWSATGERFSINAAGLDVPLSWTLAGCAALTTVGLLFSWRVDVNDFSLHHFYKNRLVRCYLGASNSRDRRADWFTGFDPHDDLPLRDFDHHAPDRQERPAYPGPYPILNCALNLVGGEDLAWQERKSTSFVFTPKYCGYDVDRALLTSAQDVPPIAVPGRTWRPEQGTAAGGLRALLGPVWRAVRAPLRPAWLRIRAVLKPARLRDDAYVRTAAYYRPGEGPSLGMAMAISGAAANPNMGRASSPALAFLMTVFNVRLGWWVGNPRETDGVKTPSPRMGLPYTALELFGRTDDRKRYVNLSDGGHFENLGVYELIRRGCRYIIACDAGQDGRFFAEDLGRLVRQCRTDFGVEIDIDIERIRQRTTAGLSHTHCVVGRIRYLSIPRRTSSGRLVNPDGGPVLPGSRPAHEEGYLVYLKPSLTGDEAQDLLEYVRRVPDFPHQTTADQWFDESQFESYRKLGMHIGEDTFRRYQDDDTKPLGDIDRLFARLYTHWYPPSVAINENTTAHVLEYTRIMELIRAEGHLGPLDHTMFEKWPDAGESVDPRDEFYICNALIQLIENVYADLNLEELWEHPHVQGWRSVFERWAQQPAFRRTWRLAEGTYADRFRNFYNDRLRGRVITLPPAFVASHRGRDADQSHRENSLEAFANVIDQGASVIELDVRRSADGHLVLWHDEQVDGRPVSEESLDEIRRRAGYPVPTLAECAKALHGIVQLDVEIKVEGIEKAVIDALRAPSCEWRREDFVLTSFHHGVIEAARACDPCVRTGLLVDTADGLAQAFDNFVELRTDFLAPAHSLVDTGDSDTSSPQEARCVRAATERLDRAVTENVPLVPWSDAATGLSAQERRRKEARLATLLRHKAVAGVITDDVCGAMDVKRTL
jgi:glycerophosphoryl diester phosphodiesterase